jgi:hypothetical protein
MVGIGVRIKQCNPVRDRFMHHPTTQCVPSNTVNTCEEERMVGHHKISLDINCLVNDFNRWIKGEKYPLNGGSRIATNQTDTVPTISGLRWEMTIKDCADIKNIRHIDRLPSRYDKGGATRRVTPHFWLD